MARQQGIGSRAVAGTLALLLLASAAAISCGPARPERQTVTGDAALGADTAPVTIEEYAAPTCPACKQWHDDVFPLLKSRFIETGKVKFVLRETPSHNKPVDAAIFAIARCARSMGYFEVIDLAFARRDEIERASLSPGGPKAALADLAATAGIEASSLALCLDEPAFARHLAEVRAEAIARGVRATPTFFVNGRKLRDDVSASAERFLDEINTAVRLP